VIVLLAVIGSPVAAQLKVRVVDEPTRLGIGSATLTVLSDERTVTSVVSDTLGFFFVSLAATGKYVFRVEALGYVMDTREVEVDLQAPPTIAAFVLRPEALKMNTLVVTGPGSTRDPNVGFARRSQMLTGARIAELRARAFSLESAIRQLSGLRVRSLGRGMLCVESTRALMSFGNLSQPGGPTRPAVNSCKMVVVVVNDIPETDSDWLTSATLDVFESVEYYSPAEAGFRYGLEASARGALVLWTRGRGPHKAPNAWISPKR
jgi:hypothetical protein